MLDREQHDSIVAPVSEDLPNLGIAKPSFGWHLGYVRCAGLLNEEEMELALEAHAKIFYQMRTRL